MPNLGAETITTLAILLLIVVLPGLAIAAAAGLRGWLLAAAAPLLTFGLVGTAGSVLPALGLLWTPAALVVVAFVGTAVTVLARLAVTRLRRRRAATAASDAEPDAAATPDASTSMTVRCGWRLVDHLGVAAAVLVSAGVGFSVTAMATAEFTAIPQFWDTAFHSNAIRYIADTGESSPAALSALSEPASETYYPNTFHVVAATLVMATGVEATAALEFPIALMPGLFALGVAALVRTVSGRPAIALASALLACAFSAFPYDLAGVLLPYVMGLALLPAFLAQWADVLRSDVPGRVARAVALGLGAVGLLALHPSTVVSAAVLAAAYLLQAWWQRRPAVRDVVVIGVGALATGVLGAPLLVASAGVAASDPFDWPVAMPAALAVGDVVVLSHAHATPQWWLALVVALGLFGLRRHPELRWLAAGGLVFAVIFVMASSYESDLVELLSRPWWNDRWRLVALWAVTVAPLAGAGVVAVRDIALDALRLARVPGWLRVGRWRLVPASLLAALLLAFVALGDGLYRDRNTERLAEAFTDGPTVSRAERDGFSQIATVIPPDSLVMNDPFDGSPMMYALEGVRPVFAQVLNYQLDIANLSPDRRLMFESFRELDRDPAVRETVRRLGITHVVVSSGLVYPAAAPAPGMRDLDTVESLELVFRTPTTTLYEVRADGPATLS